MIYLVNVFKDVPGSKPLATFNKTTEHIQSSTILRRFLSPFHFYGNLSFTLRVIPVLKCKDTFRPRKFEITFGMLLVTVETYRQNYRQILPSTD